MLFEARKQRWSMFVSDEENAKHQAKLHLQQDTIESLTATLEEKTARNLAASDSAQRSSDVLSTLLRQIHTLAL